MTTFTPTTKQEHIQVAFENDSYGRGASRYNAANLQRGLGGRSSSRKIFDDIIINTIEAIEEVQAKWAPTIGHANTPEWKKWFVKLDAKKTAWLTIYEMLGSHKDETAIVKSYGIKVSTLSSRVGKSVTDQYRFDEGLKALKSAGKTDKTAKYAAKRVAEGVKDGAAKGGRTKEKAINAAKAAFDGKPTQTTATAVGHYLITAAMATGAVWFQLNAKNLGAANKDRRIGLTEKAVTDIANADKAMQFNRPRYMPTLIQPRAWTRQEDGRIVGGYYLIDTIPFVSGKDHNGHTADHAADISDMDIEATNIIQNTAWAINTKVLAVLNEKMDSKHIDAGLYEDVELIAARHKVDDATYASMNETEKKNHGKRLKADLEASAKASANMSTLGKMADIANELKDQATIYFPHKCDFRLRRYAVAEALNPQGNDVAKGLLHFANGVALGKSGLRWLMIHVANTAGEDKKLMNERVQWVRDNEGDIISYAADPIANNGWVSVDSPFCFLAACFEYAEAVLSGNPEEYVSHLAIALDGSNNGVQHLSLIARDAVTAKMTNCSSDPIRHDIYLFIRDAVEKIVNARAVEGEGNAVLWTQVGIKRHDVKRAVMTLGYGVTKFGVKDQLYDAWDEAEKGMPVNREMSYYLGDVIWETFGAGELKNIINTMNFFQEVAHTLRVANTPFKWQTPTGTVITQNYRVSKLTEIKTLVTEMKLDLRTSITEENKTGGFMRKQKTSAAPNFVHSHDACHLALTALEVNKHGVTDFAFIHDSFGVHAGHTDILAAALRATLVKMYDRNVLADLVAFVKTYADVELNGVPEMGTFDITEVLNAEYVFA